MRKLDLERYPTHHQKDDGTPVLFDVRSSAIEVLFVDGRLTAVERLKREELARRIENEPTETLLVENADWDRLNEGMAMATMPGREFNEFVRRIVEAPTVQVEERLRSVS